MPKKPTGPETKKNDDGSTQETHRLQKGGEAPTTRFGMEDGDNTDVPVTGLDPERQSPAKK